MFFNKEWERLHGLETEYVKMFYYDFDHGFSDVYHSYAYHGVCTIIEGEKVVKVDQGADFTYNANEYVLLAPHSEVHMTMPVKTKAMVLELNDDLIENVSKKLALEYDYHVDLKNYTYYHSRMGQLLFQAMTTINQTMDMEKQDQGFFIDLAAQKLTYSLLKEEGARYFLHHDMSDHPMRRAVDLIHELSHDELKITHIAGVLHMSVSAFSNNFKKYYGVTPKVYIRDYKLNKAKKMLENYTVGEVSFELGYQNVSYFIDLFKKKFKITPKQYQLRYMSTRQENLQRLTV